ncbi:MAG TPA: RGCVC family protein [Trebonia sp.]|jgi:hypothetical protein|nr:RGCVC family protein [Trebonia sp.]
MTTPSPDEQPEAACPCGHAADEHDSLASRYCRATVTGGLDRGCMCVRVSAPLRR